MRALLFVLAIAGFAVSACKGDALREAIERRTSPPNLVAGPGIAELIVEWGQSPDDTCSTGVLILTMTATTPHAFYVGAEASGVQVGNSEAQYISSSGMSERWVLYARPEDGTIAVRGLSGGPPNINANCRPPAEFVDRH